MSESNAIIEPERINHSQNDAGEVVNLWQWGEKDDHPWWQATLRSRPTWEDAELTIRTFELFTRTLLDYAAKPDSEAVQAILRAHGFGGAE